MSQMLYWEEQLVELKADRLLSEPLVITNHLVGINLTSKVAKMQLSQSCARDNQVLELKWPVSQELSLKMLHLKSYHLIAIEM